MGPFRFFILLALTTAFLASVTPGLTQPARPASGIARSGVLRVALLAGNEVLLSGSPADGSFGGVGVDMGRAMASDLGVPATFLQLSPIQMALRPDTWDVGFLPVEVAMMQRLPASNPYLQYDTTYVVPGGSTAQSVAEIDQAGMRIAVVASSPEAQLLPRQIQRASIVSADSMDTAVSLFTTGAVDAVAANRPAALRLTTLVPDARVLLDGFLPLSEAIAVPPTSAPLIGAVNDFVERAKESGVVAASVERSGLAGVSIPPAMAAQPLTFAPAPRLGQFFLSEGASGPPAVAIVAPTRPVQSGFVPPFSTPTRITYYHGAAITFTPSLTPTITGTPIITASATATSTQTLIPTLTLALTSTPTSPPSATSTPTATATPTRAVSATPSQTSSTTSTPQTTLTQTATQTATPTASATSTDTPTATATVTLTDTPTATATSSPTLTQTQTATVTPTVGPGAVRPFGITEGNDSAVWFTEQQANRIGRIDPNTFAVTHFNIPTAGSAPGKILPDPNPAVPVLWFTERAGNKIANVSQGGTFAEFPLPNPNCGPNDITHGPGGVWFTEQTCNRIGVISTTTTAITEFVVPTPNSQPASIVMDAAGRMWFTELAGNKIGMFDPNTSTFQEFPLPVANSLPFEIALGPDNNIWFTEIAGNKVARILTDGSGTVTEATLPTPSASPTGITTAFGSMWVTEQGGNKLVSIDVPTVTVETEFPVPSLNAAPTDVVFGPNAFLWFTELNIDRVASFDPNTDTFAEHPVP